MPEKRRPRNGGAPCGERGAGPEKRGFEDLSEEGRRPQKKDRGPHQGKSRIQAGQQTQFWARDTRPPPAPRPGRRKKPGPVPSRGRGPNLPTLLAASFGRRGRAAGWPQTASPPHISSHQNKNRGQTRRANLDNQTSCDQLKARGQRLVRSGIASGIALGFSATALPIVIGAPHWLGSEFKEGHQEGSHQNKGVPTRVCPPLPRRPGILIVGWKPLMIRRRKSSPPTVNKAGGQALAPPGPILDWARRLVRRQGFPRHGAGSGPRSVGSTSAVVLPAWTFNRLRRRRGGVQERLLRKGARSTIPTQER